MRLELAVWALSISKSAAARRVVVERDDVAQSVKLKSKPRANFDAEQSPRVAHWLSNLAAVASRVLAFVSDAETASHLG
jgi:hypothetical protein